MALTLKFEDKKALEALRTNYGIRPLIEALAEIEQERALRFDSMEGAHRNASKARRTAGKLLTFAKGVD